MNDRQHTSDENTPDRSQWIWCKGKGNCGCVAPSCCYEPNLQPNFEAGRVNAPSGTTSKVGVQQPRKPAESPASLMCELTQWAEYWAAAKAHNDGDRGWKSAAEEVLSMIRKARPTHETCDGYKDAFYQIAEVLNMPAMPISPKEAFETAMLPKLRQLVAGEMGEGPSDDKGRNGPDNKCCFRHFCKAESVVAQRVMARNDTLKELLEDIVQAPGRTPLLDQFITRASLWLRTDQLIEKPCGPPLEAMSRHAHAQKASEQCTPCAEGMNSFTDPDTGKKMHARNGTVTICSTSTALELRCECGISEVWPEQFNPNCPRHKGIKSAGSE